MIYYCFSDKLPIVCGRTFAGNNNHLEYYLAFEMERKPICSKTIQTLDWDLIRAERGFRFSSAVATVESILIPDTCDFMHGNTVPGFLSTTIILHRPLSYPPDRLINLWAVLGCLPDARYAHEGNSITSSLSFSIATPPLVVADLIKDRLDDNLEPIWD